MVPIIEASITLYCDDSVAVANSLEPRIHKRSKNIKRKYHLIRDITQRGDVRALKIELKKNLEDPFTKVLSQSLLIRMWMKCVFKMYMHGYKSWEIIGIYY